MNGLTIIYIIGAGAVGLIVGMIVEMIIDSEAIRELQDNNRKLKLELEQSKKEPEIIEIHDKWNVYATEQEEITFPNTQGF